jgi:hypothetical protein
LTTAHLGAGEDEAAPAELAPRHRGLGGDTIHHRRSGDVGEPRREAIHQGDAGEEQAGDVVHGDRVGDELPAGDVQERRRLGDGERARQLRISGMWLLKISLEPGVRLLSRRRCR